jgi:hypothetical protein
MQFGIMPNRFYKFAIAMSYLSLYTKLNALPASHRYTGAKTTYDIFTSY